MYRWIDAPEAVWEVPLFAVSGVLLFVAAGVGIWLCAFRRSAESMPGEFRSAVPLDEGHPPKGTPSAANRHRSLRANGTEAAGSRRGKVGSNRKGGTGEGGALLTNGHEDDGPGNEIKANQTRWLSKQEDAELEHERRIVVLESLQELERAQRSAGGAAEAHRRDRDGALLGMEQTPALINEPLTI